jgi:hypothetical protein
MKFWFNGLPFATKGEQSFKYWFNGLPFTELSEISATPLSASAASDLQSWLDEIGYTLLPIVLSQDVADSLGITDDYVAVALIPTTYYLDLNDSFTLSDDPIVILLPVQLYESLADSLVMADQLATIFTTSIDPTLRADALDYYRRWLNDIQ